MVRHVLENGPEPARKRRMRISRGHASVLVGAVGVLLAFLGCTELGRPGHNVIAVMDVIHKCGEAPVASIREKYNYEGRPVEAIHSLRLAEIMQDVGMIKASNSEDGSVEVQVERKSGSFVEVWIGRAVFPSGWGDYLLVLQMTHREHLGFIEKVCWVREQHEPPTQYWFLDLKERRIEFDWPASADYPHAFDVTLPDRSLYPYVGDIALKVRIQPHKILK